MKSITAVGYLTKDCEVVDSEKSSFVKFSIAVDEDRKHLWLES